MAQLSDTPAPPYYAAIFTSLTTELEADAYAAMATRMFELAANQPGYLGVESAKSPGGLGITVSYWKTREDIEQWKANADHQIAQQKGREVWYSSYALRIAFVEDSYSFER